MARTDESSDLETAREAYRARAWKTAFQSFSAADAADPLAADDVEKLALCAALIGDDRTFIELQERCYQLYHDAGKPLEAGHAAFWAGFRSLGLGDMGRATAWLGRCQRAALADGEDNVLGAYLMIPETFRRLMSGELEEAVEVAGRAVDAGERFSDKGVVAMAQNLKGRALLGLGNRAEGLALLDESMLPVLANEVSPVFAGIIYCGVIAHCHRYCELDRAREWTQALTDWCETQPELVTFRGNCQVHRSEVSQLSGDWDEALTRAASACSQAEASRTPDFAAAAYYQHAELRRLRGEVEQAEAAYQQASQLGREPQPGLALLRLAQGRKDAARQGLVRALAEARDPFLRATLLTAGVEVELAVGDSQSAQAAAKELEALASRYDNEVLSAWSAWARGVVCLAQGDARAALGPLRHAFFVWQRIGVPYMQARLQVELAKACEALGDSDGAQVSRSAAKQVFERLGARPNLQALEGASGSEPAPAFGLTARELQVLRLVAAGKTNKEVATELAVSERTVDRHVSNVFRKLNVTTRAAATAAAFKQGLVSE